MDEPKKLTPRLPGQTEEQTPEPTQREWTIPEMVAAMSPPRPKGWKRSPEEVKVIMDLLLDPANREKLLSKSDN